MEAKGSRAPVTKNLSERPAVENYKSKEKLEEVGAKSATGRESGGIYGSNNDLSLSSNSKAHQT